MNAIKPTAKTKTGEFEEIKAEKYCACENNNVPFQIYLQKLWLYPSRISVSVGTGSCNRDGFIHLCFGRQLSHLFIIFMHFKLEDNSELYNKSTNTFCEFSMIFDSTIKLL